MPHLSTEAEVWYKNYFESLSRWQQSGNSDSNALDQCIGSIDHLLDRSPENHVLAQKLCVQLSMIGQNVFSLDQITKLTELGALTGIIADGTGSSDIFLRLSLIKLVKAKIALDERKRVEGILALRALNSSFLKAEDNQVTNWVKAKWQYLTGQLNELGLERINAFDNFKNGASYAASILTDKKKLVIFFDEWYDLVYQEEFKTKKNESPLSAATPALELKTIYTYCLMGLLRNFIENDAGIEKKKLAQKTADAIKEYGLPQTIHPVEIIKILEAVSTKEGTAFSEWLLQEGINNLYLPKEIETLNQPPTVSIYNQLLENSIKKLKVVRPLWEACVKIGLAKAFWEEKNLDETERLRVDAIEIAARDRMAILKPLVFGFTTSFYYWNKRPGIEEMTDLFMFSFAAMIETDKTVWESPQLRGIFDQPIDISLEIAIKKFLTNRKDEAARTRLSVLLDLSRSSELPYLKSFYMPSSSDDKNPPIDDAFQIVSDTIGRVAFAIKDYPLTSAIIIQSLSDSKTCFILINSEFADPQVYTANGSYIVEIDKLIALQKDTLSSIQAGVVDQDDALLKQGQSAFESMPKEIRQAINDCNTILFVPDFRTNQDVIPFELMHNGKDYLGEQKVIARFISLSQLASTLDSPSRTPGQARALITQASTTDEMAWLSSAAGECNTISYLLEKKGYDVPAIDQNRLSSSFFVDRFSYVDIWHIAAHGESEAGEEWLVLPNRQKMVVDDFYSKPQHSFPFVYLNACHLGETRYLGASISKGIAFNLVEIGAPAVIANTIEMLDKETSIFAISFYKFALTESVGKALLLARNDVLKQDISPIIWGSAILLGNPFHVLPNSETKHSEKEDIASDLLNASLGMDTERISEMWQKAVQVLREPSAKPRVKASMLLIESLSTLTKIDSKESFMKLEDCIRLADLLKHLPARGMLRFIKAKSYYELGLDQRTFISLQETLQYLETLTNFDSRWNSLQLEVHQMLKEIENKGIFTQQT